jgi:hypothetical protein
MWYIIVIFIKLLNKFASFIFIFRISRCPFPYLWRHSSMTSKYVSRHISCMEVSHEGKYCTKFLNQYSFICHKYLIDSANSYVPRCTITNKQNVELWKLLTSWGHTKVLFTPLIQWSVMFCRPCFNRFWGLKYIPRLFSEYMLTFMVEEPMKMCEVYKMHYIWNCIDLEM